MTPYRRQVEPTRYIGRSNTPFGFQSFRWESYGSAGTELVARSGHAAIAVHTVTWVKRQVALANLVNRHSCPGTCRLCGCSHSLLRISVTRVIERPRSSAINTNSNHSPPALHPLIPPNSKLKSWLAPVTSNYHHRYTRTLKYYFGFKLSNIRRPSLHPMLSNLS